MLSLENVIAQLAVYASLELSEAQRYSPLCQSAISSILNALKPNIDVAFHASRLENASAMIAYYRYILLQSAENCHNIKIGEIQLSASSNLGLNAVMTMKDEMLLSVCDLICYDGFCFKQV